MRRFWRTLWRPARGRSAWPSAPRLASVWARGTGALVGPFFAVPWASQRDGRLRLGILFGFLAIFAGYLILSAAPFVWIACLALVLAHGGGSTIWVFSTTLLMKSTEDKFRGRVVSADLGL